MTRGVNAMNSIARGFLISAIVYGVLGMLLGLEMGITHNHGQMPTHAHILVIGWVSFFLFGLYYLQFGKVTSRALSLVHFWMAQCALIALVIGLWLIYSGRNQYDPIAAVASIAYALSFLVFAAAAVPVLWTRRD
jgi:cbb3-type cytochrome oxidase subunit 1